MGQSAGVRIAMRTDATLLRLRVNVLKMIEDRVLPLPSAVYDVTVGGQIVSSASSDVGDASSSRSSGPTAVPYPARIPSWSSGCPGRGA
ncbi:hypothetical protein [Tessaracoccus coleopterorum]|uniref:hypothetical protein n=1 Tax=Tessaracoccus coleopterorum TaxID=2714950 RepID=UPI0018D2E87F|nr:hypothetical protein [Tessaracoccus coleopterorum]